MEDISGSTFLSDSQEIRKTNEGENKIVLTLFKLARGLEIALHETEHMLVQRGKDPVPVLAGVGCAWMRPWVCCVCAPGMLGPGEQRGLCTF